jgi:metal-responsive CopG/Arc/MetJ family transcriptional regulator
MVTVSFSVPDEVTEAFDCAFEGRNKNEIVAELMRKAVADTEWQARQREAIGGLTESRRLRPKLTDDEIRTARTEGRP